MDAELQFADVVLKLQTAVSSSVRMDNSPTDRQWVCDFQSEVLSIAQRMPHEDNEDDDEDNPSLQGCRSMLLVASNAAHHLLNADMTNGLADNDVISYAMSDLLRTAARGSLSSRVEQKLASVNESREWGEYCNFTPMKLWMVKEQASAYSETYVAADVMNAVLCEGQKKLLQLSAMYVPPRAPVFRRINMALNMQTLPLLFDGLRLRAGAHMSCAYASSEAGAFAFGTEYLSPRIFTGADSLLDCARVCRSAAFLIATAQMGAEAYGLGELQTVSALKDKITSRIGSIGHGKRGPSSSPNRAMRLIMTEIALFAESVLETKSDQGNALALRMAMNVPCLHPSLDFAMDEHTASEYDGGTLSVWDAVQLLVRLRNSLKLPPLQAAPLLSTVFAGVLYHLMIPEREKQGDAGPFVASQELAERTSSIMEAWWKDCTYTLPSKKLDASDDKKRLADAARKGRLERGKLVSANVSICSAILGGQFKQNKERSATSDTRYCAAISMLGMCESFQQELRRIGKECVESRPTDGIAPLKRLYVAMLCTEPAVINYMRTNPRAGNPLYEDSRKRKTTMPTEDSDAIESPWREVSGAAILLHGLHAITTAAFNRTLRDDWEPLPAVQHALAIHRGCKVENPLPNAIITPMKAMQQLSKCANTVCLNVFNTALIDERKEGSEDKQRILAQQLHLANVAFQHAIYSPLWESMIQNLVTNTAKMRSGNTHGKKARVAGGAAKKPKRVTNTKP